MQKASQSLRPQAQKIGIIFHRDMRVGKNTSQAASVEFCRKRQNYARSRLQAFWQKIPQEFSPVVFIRADPHFHWCGC